MATISVNVSGIDELQAELRRMGKIGIPEGFFLKAAFRIQSNAAKKQILSGGGGKKNAKAPHPYQLTSRTGTGRRSIRVNRGPLPNAIEIGTDLVYMSLHEHGGVADFPSRMVKAA